MCFCAREKNQREWRESRQASFDPQGDRDEAWQNRLHYRFSSRSRRFIFEAPQFSWRRRVVMRITFVGESPHILANVSVLVSLPITSEKNQSRTQAPESQTGTTVTHQHERQASRCDRKTTGSPCARDGVGKWNCSREGGEINHAAVEAMDS